MSDPIESASDFAADEVRAFSVDLQRFFRKRSGLRPLVLPVVMEI